MSNSTNYWFAPRRLRIKFTLLDVFRIPCFILAVCAIIDFPLQFWIEHDSLRWFVVGVTAADSCWGMRFEMLQWVKADDDESPSRRMLIKLIAAPLFRTLWSVFTVCALVKFPQQVWIEFDSVRWFVIGAMLPDGFWALMLALANFAEDHDRPPRPRRILAKRVARLAFRIDWFILAICALLGFPRQLWIEFEPLRWTVTGAMLGDFCWAVPRFLADFRKDREASRRNSWQSHTLSDPEKDRLPSLCRRLMMFSVVALFRVLWFILTMCAMVGFPQHVWAEYGPLRWIVIGAMLGDWFWAVPQGLARLREDREASR